jgi:hypothetical protein
MRSPARALVLSEKHSTETIRMASTLQGDYAGYDRDVPRDLYKIFGNKVPFAVGRHKRIKIESQDSLRRPPYCIEAARTSFAEWQVNFGDLTNMEQAAAWTALSLYEQRHGYGRAPGTRGSMLIDDLQASPETLAVYGKNAISDMRCALEAVECDSDAAHLSWKVYSTCMLDLPSVLDILNTERQFLYGSEADPLAVTALTGAYVELAEYRKAYENARTYASPTDFAKSFLDSAIFIPVSE